MNFGIIIIIAVLYSCIGICATILFVKASKEIEECMGENAVKETIDKKSEVFIAVKNLVTLFIVSFCPIINLLIIFICINKEFMDELKSDIKKKN